MRKLNYREVNLRISDLLLQIKMFLATLITTLAVYVVSQIHKLNQRYKYLENLRNFQIIRVMLSGCLTIATVI